MIKSVFAPTHPNPLKTLLDEPFAGALNHTTAERQMLFFEALIVDMGVVALEIGLHPYQGE